MPSAPNSGNQSHSNPQNELLKTGFWQILLFFNGLIQSHSSHLFKEYVDCFVVVVVVFTLLGSNKHRDEIELLYRCKHSHAVLLNVLFTLKQQCKSPYPFIFL